VEEVRTEGGVRFVARWKKYIPDPDAQEGRRRVCGGPYELGPKVYHGPGLKSKKAAETEWLKICNEVMGRNVNLAAAEKARKTFRWFAEDYEDGFRKRREPRWSGSMPRWYDYIMGKVIFPRFGDILLNQMREQDMQVFLNELADQDYSESVVKNAKRYLKAVLEEAFAQRILEVNPARRLIKPRHTRKPQRSWVTVEEFQMILAATTSPRDRLMLRLLYVIGLRRGELFGLQWQDFNGIDTLMIERQILEDLTVGPAKTDGSIAPVAIPPDIAKDLNEWRKWCPDPRPEGWIFSSPRKAHINPGFWRKTVLIPAGKAAGIPKLTFHGFRRGFATEAHKQGINDKTIQAQLRHASASTSRDIYMQAIPAVQREAVEKFSKIVNPKVN
jgi:integrase